jgi:heat-inducible transcriptional repressor
LTKKEFLLQSIIQAYIKTDEPIGSSSLKNMYGITYSPATIRGYFKKLGDEGYLAQEHISSGRTPTIEALKEYWSNRLNFNLEQVNYENIEYLAKQQDLTVFIKQQINDKLKRVLKIENLYMILEFDNFFITTKFNDALFRFLDEMIGLDPIEIMKISKEVGAYVLHKKLVRHLSSSAFETINIKQFLGFSVEYDLNEKIINKFLTGEILNDLADGIYFEDLLPSGYIGINRSTSIKGDDVNLFVVGHLSKDYEYFYKGIVA